MGEKTANLFSTKKDDAGEAIHDAGETISEKASDASEYVSDKGKQILLIQLYTQMFLKINLFLKLKAPENQLKVPE